jgi:hypothetical protein
MVASRNDGEIGVAGYRMVAYLANNHFDKKPYHYDTVWRVSINRLLK